MPFLVAHHGSEATGRDGAGSLTTAKVKGAEARTSAKTTAQVKDVTKNDAEVRSSAEKKDGDEEKSGTETKDGAEERSSERDKRQ